jgi:hypothetical protein
MDSPLTLHDFVLNLLSDSAARSAFEIDPEGALHDAGLNDITAADVQEVIPLVVDYAPIGDLAGLEDLGDLTPAGLDTDPAAAIHQLQAVTDQLAVGGAGVDVNIAAGGAITVHSAGLAPDPLALSDIGLGLGTGLTGDLSVTTDPAGTLDLDGTVGADGVVQVTTPVDTSATLGAGGVVDATGLVGTSGTGVLDTAVDGVLGTVDITANTVTEGLLPHQVDLTDPLGQLDGLPVVDHPLPVVDHPLQHVGGGLPSVAGDGGIGGAVDGIGDLTGGHLLGEHGVTGAVGTTVTDAVDLPF